MKKSQKTKKNDNFLLMVPQIAHLNWKEEKEIVTLFFEHNKAGEKIMQKVFHKPAVTDIALDEYGSWIWKNIDGSRNIKEIAEGFLARFANEANVYERLTLFVGYLYRKKWVRFVSNGK